MKRQKRQLEEPLLGGGNELVPISDKKKTSKIAAKLVLVIEFLERLCYYSTLGNLLIFCFAFVGISKINSLLIVLVFIGASYFLSLAGCWISDSISGRYNMILASIVLYIVGSVGLSISSYYEKQLVFDVKIATLIVSLVLVAGGAAGIRSNISVFAAKQASP